MSARLCIVAVLCILQIFITHAADPDGTFCMGQRQSPVNINTNKLVKRHLPRLEFSRGYYEKPLTQQLVSDGHSVVVTGTFQNQPAISGGPLKGSYNLHSFHFHWGVNNSEGSEHLLNNKSYALEMHVVHTKDGLSFDQAKAIPDGLSVIEYFINVSPGFSLRTNPFTILTQTMQALTEPQTAQDMVRLFQMSKLVVPFKYDYVTYDGSLTTGDCQETVIWIVSSRVLKINPKQMQVFRNLQPRKLVEDAQNFRSVQPLNGRTIYQATPKWA